MAYFFRFVFISLLLTGALASCSSEKEVAVIEPETPLPINAFTQDDYSKKEFYIEMRDGTKLWTTVYSPKDTTQQYPLLIKRTPYSCSPYGADTMPEKLMHNPELIASGYHFVVQDVRGRWMSEGKFENVKPPYSFDDSKKTDEVTDSYDTFEWLENNLKNYTKKAGIYGNSYPGWTTLVGARSNHPTLKAAIAMAPVTNFYFEDFNRYGMFALNYVPVMNFFGTQHNGPTQEQWWPDRAEKWKNKTTGKEKPYYQFYLDRLELSNFNDILDSTNFFWERIKAHPNYDAFHQKRDWIQYLDKIDCHVMIAGGFNDEQNLYGNLNAYKKMAKHSDKIQLLLGPWSHGHNKRRDSLYYLGDIFFGVDLSKNYQENEEFNYFEHHLKGRGDVPNVKVKLYDNGNLAWHEFDEYPTNKTTIKRFYLGGNNTLSQNKKTDFKDQFYTYTSDPLHPIPYSDDDSFYNMAPKKYFTADQRFLSKRKDVLSWTSEPLTDDITVLGEIKAMIEFATSQSDADIYVKIIDVYPNDRQASEYDKEDVNYQGYERLVRMGYIRGRYRKSFEKGIPFESGEKTTVQVPLLDVFHTFKKGHRIMVQIQSSMFPLFDVNPQSWVDNIYEAKRDQFISAEQQIFFDSSIEIPVLK